MFTLLLIGMLTLTGEIKQAKSEWTGTVYIRVDGSIDPPDAPIVTYDNVTYTLTDNITSSADGIVVERDNIVIDGASHTLQGTGSGRGIFLSGRTNVTVQNIQITNFNYGIYLYGSSNYNSIVGNNLTNNGRGIYLMRSLGNNTIFGNNIASNDGGIYLDKSSNNTISENNITANNEYGIYLGWSSNYNSIVGNRITNNYDGIWIYSGSNNNSIAGNNITASNDGGIVLGLSSNNNISGNNITKSFGGIWLSNSYNNGIAGNNITNSYHGIWLQYSLNNSIAENIFVNDGLYVYDSYMIFVKNNTVNGKPLVYLETVTNYTVKNAGQVVLNRCNKIRVENLNLSETGVGIELWETNNTIIHRNNITANNEYGIWLQYSLNNSIAENNITNNGYGIWLSHSTNNTVIGNNITANNHDGILLGGDSSNNTIIGNNIANSGIGIHVYNSSNIIISGNYITANRLYGISIFSSLNNRVFRNSFVNDGLYVADTYGNEVVHNLVNGKPLVYLEGASGISVEDAGQVILVGCKDMKVKNLNLSNTTVGVQLLKTNNTIIVGNYITANSYKGIDLHYSKNNDIAGNGITNNGWKGISLFESSNNHIARNHITANNEYGIDLHHSSNNGVVGNYITENNKYGIRLYYSSNNIIYHNNFLDNAWGHVDIWKASGNIWDDGYPSGGNYWSGYDSTDADGDGIGDIPYIIDYYNRDCYPLMGPFNSFNTSVGYPVDVVSNSTIRDFQYFESNSTIVLQASNMTADQTVGFCRLTIPHNVTAPPYTVKVNGTTIDYQTIYENQTEGVSIIYFTYQHSTLKITIIPEYPTAIILPLFMVLNLVAFVFRKKREQKFQKRGG